MNKPSTLITAPADIEAAFASDFEAEGAALHTKSIVSDRLDADRYRWLRAQHELIEDDTDAEGFPIHSVAPHAFTVFRPGRDLMLEPVRCDPGALDQAIDAEMRRESEAASRGAA